MVAHCRRLEGVVPVLGTPMHADGAIDTKGQARLVEFLSARDIGGFWALGTGSEDMNLTFAQRLEAAAAVTEANAGRLPLILGAGFYCLDDILAFIDATAELEFDAYHVMPYHPLLSLARLDWFYRRIADHAPKPLWMYTSANWAPPITPDFVAGLKDHPNIAGIKFSSSNAPDQMKVIGLAAADFQVITAVVKQFYACLCMGSAAGTTSVAGAVPEPVIAIYELFKAGRHDQARDAQRRLIAFLDDWPKSIKRDNFLGAAEEKYILHLRGVCEPHVSSYYRALDEAEQAAMRQALRRHAIVPGLEPQ